jgi:hypothetical protein
VPDEQVCECLYDVGKLSIERFSRPRKKCHNIMRLDCDRSIAVELNFFCGVGRYVALTLIGDLAKRNFAEKHHII